MKKRKLPGTKESRYLENQSKQRVRKRQIMIHDDDYPFVKFMCDALRKHRRGELPIK